MDVKHVQIFAHQSLCRSFLSPSLRQVSKGFLLPGGGGVTAGAGGGSAGGRRDALPQSPDVVDADFLRNLDLDF